MKIILSFERNIGEFKETMEDLSFMEGDYYNIYHHVTMDKGLAENQKIIDSFAAFQITQITPTDITIEKMAPPIATQNLGLNQKAELNFEKYGVYIIGLKSIEE